MRKGELETSQRTSTTYQRHVDFYRDFYGQHLTRADTLDTGVALIEAVQSAGDWSDAATADLSIAWLPRGEVGMTCDLGAGQFRQTQRGGDAILIPPGVATSIQMNAPHVCRVFSAPFSRWQGLVSGAGTELPVDGDFGPLLRQTLRHPRIRSVLDEIWIRTQTPDPHVNLWADAAILQIAAVLMEMMQRVAVQPVRGSQLAPWQIRRATEYLLEHLREDVSLQDVASLVRLSPFHFCRAFKASMGLPPHRWLQQQRVERAKALLAEKRIGVMEVALEVGYDNPGYFARVFRRHTGVSPREFQRRAIN